MEHYIRPSELYEWTINNLNSLSLEEQEITLKNLEQLRWIPEMIENLNPIQRELLQIAMIKKLEEPETPFCLMFFSCIAYNLHIKNIDVNPLKIAINTSKRVQKEIEWMFLLQL
jgi:hypothetical protein